jgi:hypothetical protein
LLSQLDFLSSLPWNINLFFLRVKLIMKAELTAAPAQLQPQLLPLAAVLRQVWVATLPHLLQMLVATLPHLVWMLVATLPHLLFFLSTTAQPLPFQQTGEPSLLEELKLLFPVLSSSLQRLALRLLATRSTRLEPVKLLSFSLLWPVSILVTVFPATLIPRQNLV